MAAQAPDKPPFSRLGRYEVRAKIAEGGMAAVYVGRSLDGERPVVALKVIRPEYARDMNFVAMFLDEAKLTSRLSHPSIVKTYEQASHDGQLFIAMELLFGQSLASVWEASERKGQRLPRELVAFIGARVADGLHHAHELKDPNGVPQEVIHRDINPSNIFVTYGGQVKIIDFGLARAVDRLTRTMAGVVKGKLAYMAPEQVAGPGIDRRTDIFALGTTLWELTVGRRLFKADNDVATMCNVRDANVPEPRSIDAAYPAKLSAVLLRALAKDPALRYQTAAELGRELDAFVMAGGRIVTPATLMELMTSLFPDERDRDASWFEHAELPIRTVPLAPLSLPSMELMSEPTLQPAKIEAKEVAEAARAIAARRPADAAKADPGRAERMAATVPPAADTEPSTVGTPAGVPRLALTPGKVAFLVAVAIVVAGAVIYTLFFSD